MARAACSSALDYKSGRKLRVEWVCTQKRWNSEVANMFSAAARYRRATDGSSHDDAHPDNQTLDTGKIYSAR
jgi:hypothetical protein